MADRTRDEWDESLQYSFGLYGDQAGLVADEIVAAITRARTEGCAQAVTAARQDERAKIADEIDRLSLLLDDDDAVKRAMVGVIVKRVRRG